MRWILVAATLVVACGPASAGDDEVIVLAAASLQEPIDDIVAAFEADHSGVEVIVSLAGSAELATQIANGAPADVFISADQPNLDRALADVDAADDPTVIATNRPAIVVGASNPLGIERIADLADADLDLVLCAAEVPCGAYANGVLDEAGADVDPVSFERSVSAVVTKVALGEADAGIAYRTDAHGRDDIAVIEIETDVVASYPAVALSDAGIEFVEFLNSGTGQSMLADAGFGAP